MTTISPASPRLDRRPGWMRGPRGALAGVALMACVFLPVAAEAAPARESRTAAAVESSRVKQNLAVFDRTWELVRSRYYDPQLAGLDWERLRERFRPLAAQAGGEAELYRATNAMLQHLRDSHTQAHNRAAVAERRVRHRFTVSASAASAADGVDVRELDGGVLYLRFDTFNHAAYRWVKKQLHEHRRAPAVVLDLRENPGGVFLSAKMIAGQFFRATVPMGTVRRRSGRMSTERSWQFLSERYDGDVAVLVGRDTGSSAEVLAHALQHHGRAVVVGQRTAGAVMGSRYYRLPDGGAAQVSVTDYRALDGETLEGRGVQPDVRVAKSRRSGGEDLELRAALAALGASARP